MKVSRNVVTFGGSRVSISAGNKKTGGIPAFSMAPVRDCRNCESCSADCYALKAFRQYPATRAAWTANGDAMRVMPDTTTDAITAWIDAQKNPVPVFRLHVSGDFIDQPAVDACARLARRHPATVFFSYTKSHDLDFSRIPSNLQVRFSQWVGMAGFGADGSRAWYQDGTETRIPETAITCPATVKGRDVTCETCGACWKLNGRKDIVFNAH